LTVLESIFPGDILEAQIATSEYWVTAAFAGMGWMSAGHIFGFGCS
jgi:hypothetical protein